MTHHRIILMDSDMLFDQHVFLGAYQFQYFQALDNLAVDNNLPFLDSETKQKVFEETNGMLYGRDTLAGTLELPPPIYQAFEVDEFSQRSINKAAEWVKGGIRLSDDVMEFLQALSMIVGERTDTADEFDEEGYDVDINLLVRADNYKLYTAITTKHGEMGLSFVNEKAVGLFLDDRDCPSETNFTDLMANNYPGASIRDVYYLTADHYRYERARVMGVEKSVWVGSVPHRDAGARESFANILGEIRAFLFEAEEGGLIPNDYDGPDDDQPEYARPEFLH